MSLAKEVDTPQNITQDVIFPPAGDLYSDEPPLETELHLAEYAQERAERLAAKLRELNIDPDTI